MTEISPARWTPARAPGTVEVAGRMVRLEPLRAGVHGPHLWAAFREHDELWTFMFDGPFASESVFNAWLGERERQDGVLTRVVIDSEHGRALGLLAFMAIRTDVGVVEIGHIVFSPALQKTVAATEAIYLALKHLFDCGYRRVEWKCDHRNRASRNAAKRLGFLFEGLFHQHMIVKGENRDTSWFALLDRDWPAQRAAFEAWLRPDNFDDAGRQRRPLVAFQPD